MLQLKVEFDWPFFGFSDFPSATIGDWPPLRGKHHGGWHRSLQSQLRGRKPTRFNGMAPFPAVPGTEEPRLWGLANTFASGAHLYPAWTLKSWFRGISNQCHLSIGNGDSRSSNTEDNRTSPVKHWMLYGRNFETQWDFCAMKRSFLPGSAPARTFRAVVLVPFEVGTPNACLLRMSFLDLNLTISYHFTRISQIF